MIEVRHAQRFDCGAMARLLNVIIAAGGTTAMVRPVTGDDLADWMAKGDRAAWHVAVDGDGEIVGFQWIDSHEGLPAEAADIATFVQRGRSGLGIGSALFEVTVKAARGLGYRWISAVIRADNAGGLAYYQSRGFRDYGVLEGVELQDGSRVDKRMTRFDLD